MADSRGRFGQMNDLIEKNLVDADIYRHAHAGYFFNVTVHSTGKEFTATAEPETSATGRYSYSVTSGGQIRYSTDQNLAPAGQAGRPAP